MRALLPWIKINDNDRYARHLSDFSAVLDNVPKEQADYMESGLIAQSLSENPYSHVALDI